jgi:hypothetical protein
MADSSGLDPSEQSKTTRKQNVSCDACRFRKVRCDRRAKIESRQSNQNKDDIACTVCSSHGLRCTYTQSAPRRRRGKRIVAIQKVQSHDVDESLALRSLEQAGPSSANPYAPLFGTDVIVNEDLYDADTYANNNVQTSDARRSYIPKEGLLGVRGLSRPLLDACIKSYFKYSAPCTPILHAEVYAARYALFFAQYDKNKGVGPFWERPKEDAQSMDRPLSELLLLSVGCIGAALLEPPIADFDSKAKFRLQDRLALKFQEAINKHDLLLRLQHEGTDVVEACYIMSDPMLTVLGDDLPSRTSIDWDAIRQMDKSQRDPLRLRPASHEGIIRLIMKMGLNQNPKPRKDVPPGDDRLWDCDGIYINEREVFRRSRIFWSIFMQDTFRAMGERRNVLIGNDDYDMDLPRFIPDGDGWFTAHFWHRTTDNEKQIVDEPHKDIRRLKASKFAKFDAFQFEVMLRLNFIIRTVSVKFVSPRSRSKGVLVSDVERAVSALTAWYQQLPHEVTWECQSEPLLNALYAGRKGSSNATAMRNSLRALFAECLYHANVLAVWGSVDTFGTRSDIDILETVALLSGRLKLDDNGGQLIDNSSIKGEITRPNASDFDYSAAPLHTQKAPEEIRRAVKQLLDHLTVRSFLRIPKLAKEAARLGLVRSHRGLFLSQFSLYAVWGCGLACKVAANGGEGLGEGGSTLRVDAPPGLSLAEYIFKRVEDLIYAIGMIDSAEFAPMKVKQIQGLLQKSRGNCREINAAMQSRRSSQTSSIDATSPFSTGSRESVDDPDVASPHDAPFRYYFKTGGRRGFSEMPTVAPETKLSIPKENHSSSSSSKDTDEVSMLAQAVSGYGSSPFALDRPSPTSTFASGNTPEANKAGYTQDATLDFDLESISGMDTDWLHSFLQGGTPGWDASNQHPDPNLVPTQNAPSFYDNSQSSMQSQSMANDAAAAQFFQSQSVPSNQTDANNSTAYVAPPAVLTGVDTQWDQFMANADAQLWADAQWQGFNVDSLMT